MTQDDLLKFINYKLLRGESVAKIAVAQYQKDGSPYYAVADAYSILDYAEGIDHDYYVQSKQQGTL